MSGYILQFHDSKKVGENHARYGLVARCASRGLMLPSDFWWLGALLVFLFGKRGALLFRSWWAMLYVPRALLFGALLAVDLLQYGYDLP